MREWLTNIDWNKECEELAVEDMWQKFCSLINQAINLFVPLGHSKNRKKPCWMNNSAMKSRMCVRYRESQTYNDLVEYRIAQKKAGKGYKKAKKQFERNLAKDIKSNPKSFYARVIIQTKVKDVVGPLKDGNNYWYLIPKKCVRY
jgi:predicted RNA-binding protein YlxR (DUF448 family)